MRHLSIILSIAIIVLGEAVGENLELLLLHNNDMHARFEETARNSGTCTRKTSKTGRSDPKGCVGGFARTAHEIRRYRRMAEEGQGRAVLYLNAGDTYVGTAWFGVHKWKICADFLNILQPDVMSLGNHEFDNGVAGLAPFVAAAQFPIIAANLNFTKEPSLATINKSIVLDVRGRKVGIIGHLTTDTQVISNPGQVEFHDVVASVRAESERLTEQGVGIIIVVGHSGFETDKEIARKAPLVDVVIGGHTNTFQWNGPPPDAEKPEDHYPTVIVQASGKKVPVMQAYAYTKYLGRLNVTFNDAGDLVDFGGQPELLDTAIPQAPDVLALLDKYRTEVEALDKLVVGKSRVILESTNNKCRFVECNFGNLIADAYVHFMTTISTGGGWTDYPIGLINGGDIRNTIDPTQTAGNITRGELMGSVPFDNQLVSLKLTGADLLKTLEIGARSNGETSRGEFLQVSGLQVVYNLSRPAHQRVVSVMARCGDCKVPKYEPLDLHKLYGVVTNSFLTNGGDGHHILRDKAVGMMSQDLGDLDVIERYIRSQSLVYPGEEGRIQFVHTEETSESGAFRIHSSALSSMVALWLLLTYY